MKEQFVSKDGTEYMIRTPKKTDAKMLLKFINKIIKYL